MSPDSIDLTVRQGRRVLREQRRREGWGGEEKGAKRGEEKGRVLREERSREGC